MTPDATFVVVIKLNEAYNRIPDVRENSLRAIYDNLRKVGVLDVSVSEFQVFRRDNVIWIDRDPVSDSSDE